MKKIKFLLLMLLLVIPCYTYAYSDYVIASGENIGIKLKTNGIIIMGNYDETNSNLKEGDIIVSINGTNNINIDKLTEAISNNSTDTIKIGYIRDGRIAYTNLNIQNGKTGLYLKDTITGIGTLTFIDPNTKVFGALGHEIIDTMSGMIVDIYEGNIYDSNVTSIRGSDTGNPGEKNASINQKIKGDIDTNTNKGLYGDYIDKIDKNNLYKVANFKDIKKGKAYILTELEDNIVNKYEIEILKLDNSSSIKNIIFKVTDKKLLEIGGIVQGMSGSPIIQNDYIIGAVTHVVVNNPNKGYGILITNMLEEAEKKDD